MPESAVWLIVLWLFAVGGIVGSFLNVVVYRLPLGISIVYPPSRCPKCGKHIRWFDNVPIFGWIMLRGRCRQCHDPISVRYPIVEAVTASMFARLAVAELPQFLAIYPYHLLLLCTLLCAGLIEYDGHRPPLRLFVPALLVGVVAPLVWPALRPLTMWPDLPASLKGAVDGLAGVAVGALFGGIAWGAMPSPKPLGLLLGLICVGLFLGFPAVAVVAVLTALIELTQWLLGRVSRRLRIPSSLSLGIFTLGVIVFAAMTTSGSILWP